MSKNGKDPLNIINVLEILADIESRYPDDLFPIDGESRECAGARFARGIVNEIRERVRNIKGETHVDELAPGELARRYKLSNSGIYRRLHHRLCPKTNRRFGPSGRMLTVEVTEALDKFLSQAAAPGSALAPA